MPPKYKKHLVNTQMLFHVLEYSLVTSVVFTENPEYNPLSKTSRKKWLQN